MGTNMTLFKHLIVEVNSKTHIHSLGSNTTEIMVQYVDTKMELKHYNVNVKQPVWFQTRIYCSAKREVWFELEMLVIL